MAFAPISPALPGAQASADYRWMQLILGVWAVVVMLKCLGEAHRFSAWRALGAFILSWMIFTVCMLTPAVVAFLVLRGIS